MEEAKEAVFAELVAEVRRRLSEELRAQREAIEKIERGLTELRGRSEQLQAAVERELGALEQFKPPEPAPAPQEAPFEELLASVRNLITGTVPEQVFDALTEEGEKMHVRSAVFDVRGRAAWGVSARGFGSALSEKTLHALAVPLNQDNPFRQVYETGGHVDATFQNFKKNRNVTEKFHPPHDQPILLLPIRSAGSVTAIFYGDMGESGLPLPVDVLKILTEFAGAQLDRLMALSGEIVAGPARAEAAPAEAEGEAAIEAEAVEPEVAVEPVAVPEPAPAPSEVAEPPAPARVEERPPTESQAAPAPAGGAPDLLQLSESDQKVHKDARRFSKLLVSEIELYNKAKVAEGRKNKDLYKRLKSDIDRSRQTYQKRFGKTVADQFDYFHEELIKTLAASDASALGSDYPGPSA